MSDFRLDFQASQDISGTFKYIANDNFRAAEHWRDKLIDLFVLLAKNPYMGQRRPELALELRSISSGNYVVYFRPKSGYIEIARVLHGARNIDDIFRRKES